MNFQPTTQPPTHLLRWPIHALFLLEATCRRAAIRLVYPDHVTAVLAEGLGFWRTRSRCACGVLRPTTVF